MNFVTFISWESLSCLASLENPTLYEFGIYYISWIGPLWVINMRYNDMRLISFISQMKNILSEYVATSLLFLVSMTALMTSANLESLLWVMVTLFTPAYILVLPRGGGLGTVYLCDKVFVSNSRIIPSEQAHVIVSLAIEHENALSTLIFIHLSSFLFLSNIKMCPSLARA